MIRYANAIEGHKKLDGDNVNDTYKVRLKIEDGTIVSAFLKDIDQEYVAREIISSYVADFCGAPTPRTFICVVQK
jgi:hypothetical protein